MQAIQLGADVARFTLVNSIILICNILHYN